MVSVGVAGGFDGGEDLDAGIGVSDARAVRKHFNLEVAEKGLGSSRGAFAVKCRVAVAEGFSAGSFADLRGEFFIRRGAEFHRLEIMPAR